MDDEEWEEKVVMAGTFLGTLLARELHLCEQHIRQILNRHTYLITLAAREGLTHREIASMVVESEDLGPDLAGRLATDGKADLQAVTWRARRGHP